MRGFGRLVPHPTRVSRGHLGWQAWRDSNPRHPVLETGALAS